MSAWIVSVLILIVVEAVAIAVLVGVIVMAFRRYRPPHTSKPPQA